MSASRRARPASGLLLACLLAALLTPPVLAGCGGKADPFAGLYWEPSSGRRVEVERDGDAYKLFYGRDRRAYAAVREDGRLVITDPLGGKTLVRPGEEEGTLELVTGGETTLLKPLPQSQ
jgi:hypothetical protein